VLWLILAMQILTVVIAARKRVLPYVVLTLATMFLVTGQAFQIQDDLTHSSFTAYAFSRITESGFIAATRYLLVVTVISLLLAIVCKGYEAPPHLDPEFRFRPSALFYAIMLGFESALAFVLVFVVVGISAFIGSSRPGNQPGATLFIVLMSIGLFPLFLKIAYRSKVTLPDLLCFTLSLFVTAGFSRLHVILYCMVLLFAVYYGRGWALRRISVKMVFIFSVAGFLLTSFFFIFGALRDAQNFTKGSMSDLVRYNLDHPEKSLLSLQFTYRVGVEGMSGVSGAISEAKENPSEVRRDYGAQAALDGMFQLLPSALKQPFEEEIEAVQDWYWYKKPGGNVSPGLETSFVSFGWSGMVIYPVFVFLFGWIIPMKFLRYNLSPPLMLCILMATGCTPLTVRGKWSTWFAFSVAYCLIILMIWPLFATCFSRESRKKAECQASPA